MQFYCNNTAIKITSNFSDDVHFLHAFNLKFTINILYTFQPSRNSACPSCALITMVRILTVGLSLRLLCPDVSDPSSLTEHTSLKLHKEYLKTMTYNTPVLLRIKTEQFDIQNAILCQHIRELQTLKNSPLLAHPVYQWSEYLNQ